MARTRVKTAPVPGDVYGETQDLAAIEQDQSTGPAEGANRPVSPASPGPVFPANGVFGPTERPLEPPTAGLGMGAGPGVTPTLPDDPRLVARQIYAVRPTAHTFRLATGA